MALDQRATTAMPPDELRGRFAAGATVKELVASLPDGGRRLEELVALVDGGPAAALFAGLREQLNVVAILEGWCRDSMDGTAALLRLAGDNPKVVVRFFTRSEHPELMAAYRKEGRFDSIPVLLFLDAGFAEVGRYVERPDQVTRLLQGHRRELAGRDPDFAPADRPLGQFEAATRARLRAALDELRERDRQEANASIVAALGAIALHAAAGTRQGLPPGHQKPTTPAAGPDAGDACAIEW